ncbi:hypothetical protein HanIR_Chr16g0825711 [Helianthus annuus]|nr:hypothetical protein HanIR_Chr16g0825711 [Helianthus annuus]
MCVYVNGLLKEKVEMNEGSIRHTSVGSGGGTLYIGKSCQRNQHHRTCNILFQHPPLYIHIYIYICILLRSLPLSFRERNKTCRDV